MPRSTLSLTTESTNERKRAIVLSLPNEDVSPKTELNASTDYDSEVNEGEDNSSERDDLRSSAADHGKIKSGEFYMRVAGGGGCK